MEKDVKKSAESGCSNSETELRAERTLSEEELGLITGGASQGPQDQSNAAVNVLSNGQKPVPW